MTRISKKPSSKRTRPGTPTLAGRSRGKTGLPITDNRHAAKTKHLSPAGFVAQGKIESPPKSLPTVLRFNASGGSDRLPELLEKARKSPLTEKEARLLAEALRVREPWREALARAVELDNANVALQRTVSTLAAGGDLKALMEQVLLEAAGVVEAHMAAISLHDQPTDTLTMSWCVLKQAPVDLAHDPRFEFWRGPVPAHASKAWRRISQSGRYSWFSYKERSDEAPPYALAWQLAMGHYSILAVPLAPGTQPAGIMALFFQHDAPPEPERIEWARVFGHQAALAIMLARSAEQSRESAIFAERNRFARDIHDTIAQGLTGVIIQLEAAKDAIARQQGKDANEHIQRAAALARQSLAEARRSVHALKPLALEAAGLRAAFETLLANMTTGTGVHARLTVSGKMNALRPDWEENILRIGQEAVTNALRHGNPRHFNAVFACRTDGATLTFSDDGTGFDLGVPVTGMGLKGMRERATRMGWTLHISSRVGQGTEILVQLPLSGSPSLLPTNVR